MRSVFQRWESSEASTREKPKAANLRKTAEYLMNEVYTRIVELATPEQISAADLQNHSACFSEYMHKWKVANQKDVMHFEDSKVSIVSKREIFNHHIQSLLFLNGTYSQTLRMVLDQGKGLYLSEI